MTSTDDPLPSEAAAGWRMKMSRDKEAPAPQIAEVARQDKIWDATRAAGGG